MPSFLDDYLLYNAGNEAHEKFHMWAALSVLSSVVSRKVWTRKSDPRQPELGNYMWVKPNLYICLVGEQGNRKTTARDVAYELYKYICPDAVVTAERMSPEAITKFMAEDENLRYYDDPATKERIEYRPLSCFCTELKYFLGQNPLGMMEFLTAIYDREFFDVIMKNAGTDVLLKPYVTMLACETPEWIKDKLKLRIISGGIARRIIFVYETEEVKRIPFPSVSRASALAMDRCRLHLREVDKLVGEFAWTKEAADFFAAWYIDQKLPDDPTLRGFHRSMDTQAIKIAMLLAVSRHPIEKVITAENLAEAIAMLIALLPNMQKLFSGGGLNKFADPGVRILDFVERAGGFIPQEKLKSLIWSDLGGRDFNEVLQHYIDTQQLYRLIDEKFKLPDGTPIRRSLIANAEGRGKLKVVGKEKQNGQ